MAGSKVQSGKYFPNQRKGSGFGLVSQGDGGLSEMQRQANKTSDSIKLMMKREEVRSQQQISDQKTKHQNVLENRQLLDRLKDQSFNTQIKAIKTNQRRENDNYQTLIEEAQQKEEYWRWFTETGAKQWADTAKNLYEAWDIYKGKQEIKNAQDDNQYNDQVKVAQKADQNVESDLVKVSTKAQGAGDKQLTSWLVNGRVFKTNYAKRWQANQLLQQKEVLFGKIEELREQKGVGNDPQKIIEFYDFAAQKTLRDIGLSGFTPEGKNLRQAIVGEGSAIAGHIASSNRHAQQQQAYNLTFADLKTALIEPYPDSATKQKSINNKFNLAIVGYRNIQEIPGGGRQWVPNSANRQQAGVYILSQLAKDDQFISLGERAGKAALIDFVQGLAILDEKTGLPTKENWWDKWANNPNTVQSVVLDSFDKAFKTAADAEDAKHKIEDTSLKLELQNDIINGQKINLQSKEGLQQLSNTLDLATKKNYTKTIAYIKSRFPFLEDAKNGKIQWDTYVSIASAWEERDLAQMSTIIQALDTPELQRKYHNKYLSQAWAISKGNLSVTEFPDYGYEIVGESANGIFDRQKLTPHLHRTATRISDYAQALYFKKAGLLKENGSVKIGKVTVENAEDLKDEVKLTVQKEVAEGKNNPYSIWYHTDASGKLETSGFSGIMNFTSGGSLSTTFHFDKQFGRTTEGELSEDLSLEKVKIAVPGTLDNLNQLDKLLTQVDVNDEAALSSAVDIGLGLKEDTNDNYANNLLDASATSKLVESLSQGKDIIDIPNSLSKFVNNLPAKKTNHKWTVPEVLNHIFEKRGIKLSFPPALETQLLNSGYTGSKVPNNHDDVYALLLTSRYQNYGATDKLNQLPTTGAVQLYSKNQLNEYRSTAPFEEIVKTAGSVLLCNPSDGSCIPIVPQLPKK